MRQSSPARVPRSAAVATAVAGAFCLLTIGSGSPVLAQETPTPTPTHTDAPSPGSSTPSGEAPAAITVTATPAEITAGNAPQLVGRITDAAGAGVADRTITIYSKVYGAGNAYTPLASVQSDTEGYFVLGVRPLEQTAYVARYSTEVGSTAAVIRVHRRIVIEGSLAHEGGYRSGVHGRLVPAEGGVPVGITRQEADGRLTYLNQAISDGSGRFRLGFNPTEEDQKYFVYTSARHGSLRGSTFFGSQSFVERG